MDFEAIQHALDQLTQHMQAWEEMAQDTPMDDSVVIQHLEKKLAQAQMLIQEQDRLIQASLSLPSSKPEKSRVDMVLLEEWMDALEIEWHQVRLQQQHIDQERRILVEQGKQLDQDRIMFEVCNEIKQQNVANLSFVDKKCFLFL